MAEPLRSDDPRALGRFQLIERLGEGGQGIVYLGFDPGSGERVAVKVLKAADAEARARLAHEMDAVQRVRLQYCISRVIDYSFEGTRPFVVSEFVDGPSLFDRVAAQGPLRGGDLERLLAFTAQALVTIHGSGVVHRDLKPANVLLGPDGPRVVDFGIARSADQHTQSGQLVGTPSYIAPEQLQGHKASKASDVWAWACTMVFAATGYPPFGPFEQDGDNIAVILGRIVHAEPRLGDGLEAFEPLLRRCLDKDPAKRPTARQLRDELESDLEHDAPPPAPPAPPAPVPLPVPAPPAPPVSSGAPTPPVSPSVTSMDGLPSTVPPFRPQPEATVDRPSLRTLPPPVSPPPFRPPADVRPPRRRRSRLPRALLTAAVLAALAGGGWLGLRALQEGGVVPTTEAVIPQAFEGEWTGDLQIAGGPEDGRYYQARLVLYQGETAADAQFDGDRTCNGTLGIKAAQDGRLDLDLSTLDSDCPSGTLLLAPEGDGLTLTYKGSSGGTGTAALSRTG